MICEKQARGAGTLGGKAETTADQRRSDLDLPQGCKQNSTFQSFFQRPCGIDVVAGVDDQKQRRVEAQPAKAGTVRVTPLLRRFLCKAPQHETGSGFRSCHLFGDDGEGKGER